MSALSKRYGPHLWIVAQPQAFWHWPVVEAIEEVLVHARVSGAASRRVEAWGPHTSYWSISMIAEVSPSRCWRWNTSKLSMSVAAGKSERHVRLRRSCELEGRTSLAVRTCFFHVVSVGVCDMMCALLCELFSVRSACFASRRLDRLYAQPMEMCSRWSCCRPADAPRRQRSGYPDSAVEAQLQW